MADENIHPVIAKAVELAEALMESQEFKDKDSDMQTLLIAECNKIITDKTKLNYVALSGRQISCYG